MERNVFGGRMTKKDLIEFLEDYTDTTIILCRRNKDIVNANIEEFFGNSLLIFGDNDYYDYG